MDSEIDFRAIPIVLVVVPILIMLYLSNYAPNLLTQAFTLKLALAMLLGLVLMPITFWAETRSWTYALFATGLTLLAILIAAYFFRHFITADLSMPFTQ